MSRNELVASFRNTVSLSESPALKKDTERAAMSSKVYLEHFESTKKRGGQSAEIIVEENTTFSAAKKYLNKGKTAVLNFANPVTPGGGAQNGAMAQEECLCRSSNLYVCLTALPFSDYYGYNRSLNNYFNSDRLIYTKGVTVFKDDSYIPQLMPENEWFHVDVITCAAPYIALRKYTNKTALKALFKQRIKNIFEVAAENDVKVLILGAFGCGAFKNPPEVVAAAFHETINENNYTEQFEKIVFAIKSTVDGNSFNACPNLMAFELEFKGVSSELSKSRFSDGRSLSQAAGSAPLPPGRIPEGGNQFNSYEEWRSHNKYFGKQFSILGDSISTLDGYNPGGYKLFYTGNVCDITGVHDMKDTWWGKVIDYFGGELLVNNSWSGSRVSRLPDFDTLFPSGCSDERTGGLHINDTMPDVIIVYLGTNDWIYGAKTDTENGDFEEDRTVFSTAYRIMLRRLKDNYPKAEIYCCTLSETFMSAIPAFRFPYSYGGIHIEKYNSIIRRTAHKMGCKLIDIYDRHIPYDAADGSHPTAEGMNTLAAMILRSMSDEDGAAFLNCEKDHDYIEVEEQTDGRSRQVCRKCGLERWEDAVSEEL